jgi:hypothetical protein
MKNLNIPKPTYSVTTDTGIDETLSGLLTTKKKINEGTTLLGIYKKLRVMPSFASLGDYIILRRCVIFMKKNNLKILNGEIRRAMKYFKPELTIKQKNELMKTF